MTDREALKAARDALAKLCDAADETKYPLHGPQWDRLWNAAVAARAAIAQADAALAAPATHAQPQPVAVAVINGYIGPPTLDRIVRLRKGEALFIDAMQDPKR